MDIAKFFNVKSSKKIVLSSEHSEAGDQPKSKKREVEMNLQLAL